MKNNTIKDMKFFRKIAVQGMIPWKEGMDISDVFISEPDKLNGSPLEGDMIAISATDPTDKWLIAKQFMIENYEEVK